MGAQRAGRWTRWLPAGYSLLLTLLITAPLLRPGYLLLRDAVSTPRSYPTDAALGLGDAAPRAVPQDALLAALSVIVDGGVVVKAILLAALWAAGYGAAVLARDLLRAPLAAQLVATTLAVWNPYVAERLLQGHWSLLTGYAALPWTVLAALRLRGARPGPRTIPPGRQSARTREQESPANAETLPGRDPNTAPGTHGRPAHRPAHGGGAGNWAMLAGCLAAAGLTPTGALLAGVVALAVAGWRRFAGVLGLLVLACSPWLTATAVSGVAAEPSDPAGVPAFAARAEPGLGTLGSLAGLGGIWNADAVPGSRTTPLAALATLLLLIIVAFGIRTVAATDGDPERTRARRILLILAAAAVALPAFAATPAGLSVMEWLVTHLPGAGLLRDTQKFVALAVPGYTLCAAAACSVRFGRRSAESDSTAAAPPASEPGGSDSDTPGAGTSSTLDSGCPSRSAPGAGPALPGPVPGSTRVSPSRRTEATPGSPRLHAAGGAPDSSGSPAGTARTNAGPSGPADVRGGDPRFPEPASADQVSNSSPSGRAPMRSSAALVALFIGLLILPLIDLGWGVSGQMRAVRYPDSWGAVTQRIDGPGDIAVLPGGMFRRFPYSGSAPVLDPAPRMLPRDVLQTGELPVRGEVVAGEGTRARTVEDLLLAGGEPTELARLGVGWVLVERDTPGPLGESATTLDRLEPVLRTAELDLYRVPEVVPRPAPEHRNPVLGAHILWALLLVAPLIAAVITRTLHRIRLTGRPR
ncbi:hypothetical protein [Nocardia carnea]|uniref:hypothetical protein n=1 Tax=Nocardia carnea TaxID=37328 RepID=UPI002454932B|nr:hypothetical protein [Nocardia carnea]